MSDSPTGATACPSCKRTIEKANPPRRCSLCGWRACRGCAGTKFCPDCKRATMQTEGVPAADED